MKATLSAFLLVATSTIAVDAACGNNANLCNQASQVVDVLNNAAQVVSISKEQCCSSSSVEANSCPESPVETCREVLLEAPFTNDISSFCTNMTLKFNWKESNEQCCKSCACFGDPHCLSFSGTYDSWVLCDGRTKNEQAQLGLENPCPIKKPACEAQKDHMGNQCVYNSAIQPPISANGSPCRSASSQPALITMYEFSGFKFVITLGERGVITNVQITDGTNFYFLDAETCIKGGKVNPWRDSTSAKSPPSDPNWLGYKFLQEKTTTGVIWTVSGLAAGIEASISCIQLAKKGLSRINVDHLYEPKGDRTGGSGFCVADKIDKQLSTYQHTNDVKDFCWNAFSTQDAILYFCDNTYFTQVNKCKAKFCNSYSNPQGCLTTIGSTIDGWPRYYCSQNTLQSPYDPAQCTTGPCLQCMFDIYDFGWEAAIQTWGNYNGNGNGNSGGAADNSCVKWKDLPTTLGECESGVTIQYLDLDSTDFMGDNLNCWKDFVSIPNGVHICEDSLVLDSTDPTYRPLFKSQIRLRQCDKSALCGVTDKCTPAYGFDASIEIKMPDATNQIMKYWQLVREGQLVCAPGHPNCLKEAYSTDLASVECLSCQNCYDN